MEGIRSELWLHTTAIMVMEFLPSSLSPLDIELPWTSGLLNSWIQSDDCMIAFSLSDIQLTFLYEIALSLFFLLYISQYYSLIFIQLKSQKIAEIKTTFICCTLGTKRVGPEKRTCLENGKWSGKETVCLGKKKVLYHFSPLCIFFYHFNAEVCIYIYLCK